MNNLGSFLMRKREEKGLSLDTISARTRIHRRHLEAMEEGRWHDLPGPVYTRAFLRHVARLLDVDATSLIDEYEREMDGDEQTARKGPLPAPSAAIMRGPIMQWLLVLVFLGAVGAAAAHLQGVFTPVHRSEGDPVAETEDQAPSSVVAVPETDESPVEPVDMGSEAIVDDPPFPPARESPPPSAADEIPEADSLILIAEVRRDCWFEVIADGTLVYTGVVGDDTVMTWEADTYLSIKMGRPEGVYLTLNGRDLGVAGTGVVTRVFTWDDV